MSARREVVEAVNRERARCAQIIERVLWRIPPGDPVREIVAAKLERIRKPWRVERAEQKAAVPQRLRRSCGLCGGDDHTAPKCPMVGGSPVIWRRP